MANYWIEKIKLLLAKLIGGGGASESTRLTKRSEMFDDHIRRQHDEALELGAKMDRVASEIETLDSNYSAAPPVKKPLIEMQLRAAFVKLDSYKQQIKGIEYNLNQLHATGGASEQARIIKSIGITEDDVDDVALDADEAREEARGLRKAVAEIPVVIEPDVAAESQNLDYRSNAERAQASDALPPDLEARVKEFRPSEPPQT